VDFAGVFEFRLGWIDQLAAEYKVKTLAYDQLRF